MATKKNNKGSEDANVKNVAKENKVEAQQVAEPKVKYYNPFKGVSKEERRKRFRELSDNVKETAKANGITDNVNNLLTKYYKDVCGAPFLRTLEEWNAQGKRVRKGSDPFILWGKAQTTEDRTFFPMKFVYDIHQVYSPATAQQ